MANSTQPLAQTKAALGSGEVVQPRKPFSWGTILAYFVLGFGALVSLLPFIWMLNWSFMSNVEVTIGKFAPSRLMPQNIVQEIQLAAEEEGGEDFNVLTDYVFANYIETWEGAQFSKFMLNSVLITGITISGLLLFCIPAAYAFARMQFWGRNVLFGIMLATLMIPDIVTLIPNFLTVVWISRMSESLFGPGGAWLDSWPSLTIPFMASAFTIFLLRQFFAQIPTELWDASRIDGASHLQFLLRVVIPLSRAPIMTVVTFAFIGSWNSLLWPLLVVQSDTWRPIAVGLTTFVRSEAGDEFHLQMAGSVLMILPILVLYFFTQKQFTEGMWSGSFKG